MSIISIGEILEARRRISGVIDRTPLCHSESLGRMAGADIFLKAENLQKTGSFKIRGAANKILALSREEGEKGIITASSGNHGQAAAYAARMCGYRAAVVMPEGGSRVKADAIREYGAELLFCGVTSEERISYAKQLCAERGAVYVPPYDDPLVMAGQGTVGLEIMDELDGVAAVLVPTGGCGLIAGIATAVKELNPSAAVLGVEPEGSNSTGISFRAGKRTPLGAIKTIADGIRTTIPGELTFPVVQKYVDDMLTVTDEDIIRAQYLILDHCKILAEPTGAVSTAAVLCGALPEKFKGRRVVAVVSGGNVSAEQLRESPNQPCRS
jgi:threonine dehydratase